MSKHTPGPWAQAMYSPADVVTGEDKIIATARGGLNGITRDEAVANARLIAAAPDLLEALKLADAMLSGANMNASVVEKKVRAAIAKAEGK